MKINQLMNKNKGILRHMAHEQKLFGKRLLAENQQVQRINRRKERQSEVKMKGKKSGYNISDKN